MATGKKSVLLYCDLIHTVEKMDNETAGLFFKHYLRYINDLTPVADNLVVDITFESVKQNLKRDLKKWEERAEKSRLNGSKGGRPKKEPEKPTGLNENQIGLKKPITDTVTVTVNDTVIDKDINKSKSSIDEEFVFFWNTYDKKKDNKKCKTKWKNLSKSDKGIILNTVKEYVNANPDKKYRKNPLSYLNGECWNDEISKTQQKGSLPTDNLVF